VLVSVRLARPGYSTYGAMKSNGMNAYSMLLQRFQFFE
jgi:hypothetical protein